MNKTFLTILIIVAVILVGVLVYSAIVKNDTPVDVAEPTPAAIVEPTEEIAEEPVEEVVEPVEEESVVETVDVP